MAMFPVFVCRNLAIMSLRWLYWLSWCCVSLCCNDKWLNKFFIDEKHSSLLCRKV